MGWFSFKWRPLRQKEFIPLGRGYLPDTTLVSLLDFLPNTTDESG